MTITVRHSTVTNAAANPQVLVDGPAWDASHTVTGLENVDNTSDATKNSATVELLNKTISGANNTLTVRDVDLSLTDVTTNNVSTSKHGLAPKAPNDATKYLDGTGAYSVPAAFANLAKATQTGTNYTYLSTDTNKYVMRSNTGAAMIDTLPGTGTAVLPDKTYLTVYNNDTQLLTLKTASGATLDGSSGYFYLGSKQSMTIVSDGSNYFTLIKPKYAKLGAATTVYCDFSGGSDSANHGLTSGSAFKNPATLWTYFQTRIDLNGFVLTIQHADGQYLPSTFAGPLPGQIDYSGVVFKGNTGTPANVLYQGIGSIGMLFTSGAQASLGYMEFRSDTSHAIAITDAGTRVAITNTVRFGPAVLSHIYSTNYAWFGIRSNYSINSGSADTHIKAVAHGFIDGEGAYTYTITGTPAFADAFAYCGYGAFIDHKSGTFSGAVIGSRFHVPTDQFGFIHTGSSSATYFPGNAVGTGTSWD
jgi:hypothetical protein